MENKHKKNKITFYEFMPSLFGMLLLGLLIVNIYVIRSCRTACLVSDESSSIATSSEKKLPPAYLEAVKDAETADPEEISRDLTPIVKYNRDLKWQGKKGNSNVLVVTWTAENVYDSKAPSQIAKYDVWVTVAPELKNFCKKLNLLPQKLTLRLEQLLGLPPNSGKTDLVEIWVDPEDLFRPSPDPEISDREAGLDFPKSGKFLTVTNDHICWFNKTRSKSYSNGGYPWTRLGYTYDWGNPTSEIGLSEFVIKKGAQMEIHSVVEVDAYCN